MITEINDKQIADYQENGFLIYNGFINKNEIIDLKKAINNSINEMGENKIVGRDKSQQFEDKEGENYNKTVYLQRINLWKIKKYIKKFFTDKSLGEMLCKLAKVKKMRIWHDQTLQKNPWSNPTSWHLDNPKWSFYSKQSISIWIALDDATVKNGCLYFLPKSHKLAKYENDVRIGEKMDDLFELYHENIIDFELNIFNRWGQLVFFSSNPDSFWDGKINNTIAKEGVYFYKYKVKGISEKKISGHGFVTLIR